MPDRVHPLEPARGDPLSAAANGGRPVRVAVIGVGSLGQHHARIFSSLPEARLVAVVDRDPAQAGAIAARHGVPWLTDHRDLPQDLDAVSVAVPRPCTPRSPNPVSRAASRCWWKSRWR